MAIYVYIKDRQTGEELGKGIWNASGAYVLPTRGTTTGVHYIPTDGKPLGRPTGRGRERIIQACDFPGRTVVCKVWCAGEAIDTRVLAAGISACSGKWEGGPEPENKNSA